MIFSEILPERGKQTEQRGYVTKLRTDYFSNNLPEIGEQTEQMIFSKILPERDEQTEQRGFVTKLRAPSSSYFLKPNFT